MSVIAVALFALGMPNAVVLQPVMNMYSRPTLEADVVSQAIYGSNVGVVEEKDGWTRIRTADEYTGWSPSAALRKAQPYAAKGRVAEVQSLFAHVYREASVTKHAPLLTLPFESKLEATGEPTEQRWIPVRLADGRSGWVQLGDVAFDARPLTIPEAIAFSKRFLGLPYTWGGTSSFGYDCSGFAQMLGRRRGVNMPRDAQPQADWGGAVPVERSDLRPGDLLYFGSSAKEITHTGMYIGEGKFINATTHETPAVRIDDLDDAYWTKLLVAMRRLK